MSDSENEYEISYFGTPLEPYDEDAFPKKRPISVEEQVAKDAQGRRRFHGAFTGGFSAGFYNTVGSLEGWTPSEFKSSRSDKAQNKQQKAEDFMDDEDVGEFGIAPQTVRATDEYSSNKKRKKQIFPDGPIPGEPVLETLIEAGNETVGYFLMKNINRKHNKAVQDKMSGVKVYGCMMPKELPTEENLNLPEHYLHNIYKEYLLKPKSNTFGLGYTGLDKSHVNLFQPSKLTVRERNNKKLSISGQAFGVGAFEDEDEDIYVKDDMSKYDFELCGELKTSQKKTEKTKELILDIFLQSKTEILAKEVFPLPTIPASFSGKHKVKKSRFEPIADFDVPNRKDINVSVRAKYLGEETAEKSYTPSNQQHKKSAAIDTLLNNKPKVISQPSILDELISDRFVSAKQDDDITNLLEPVKPAETTHGTKEMHAAVKLKMFGPLTRITLSWQPNSLLCKRFNVPEPHFAEFNAEKKKRTKNLIFEYQKHIDAEIPQKPGLLESHPDNEATQSNIETDLKIEKPSESPPTITNTEISQESDKEPPKETIIDLTDRVDVSKNTDLFKAVFLSSSESESENEKEEETERKKQITQNVVSEPLVPKIKSTKEGILSNIDFSKFHLTRIENESSLEKATEKVEADNLIEDNIYGPKLPSKVLCNNTSSFSEVVVNNDEWIEKDLAEKKKKKKKHKKKKTKHKKHKS